MSLSHQDSQERAGWLHSANAHVWTTQLWCGSGVWLRKRAVGLQHFQKVPERDQGKMDQSVGCKAHGRV